MQHLIQNGWAYPCACSRSDIERALLAQGIEPQRHASAVYPGTCRYGLNGKTGRAWRLNVARVLDDLAGDRVVRWHDRLMGAQSQDVVSEVGDFVLRRADGLWAYQLAVVVDDGAQGHATCTCRWCWARTAKNSRNKTVRRHWISATRQQACKKREIF